MITLDFMKTMQCVYYPEFCDENGPFLAISYGRNDMSPGNTIEMSMWVRVEQCPCDSFTGDDDMVMDFSSCFDDGVESGKTEEEHQPLVSLRWEKEAARRKTREEAGRRLAKGRQDRRNQDAKLPAANDELDFRVSCVQPEQTPGPMSLEMFVLQSCYQNALKLRPEYNKTVYDLAMLLYLTSAKSYRILRQVLTFPAISGLYRVYSERLRSLRRSLTEINEVRLTAEKKAKEAKSLMPPTTVSFTLAIDAFSFQSFIVPSRSSRQADAETEESQQDLALDDESEATEVSVKPSDTEFRYGFVFMLIAHDYRIRPKVLHLVPAPSGSFSSEIGSRADEIRNICNSKGLRVWFQATDGDPGLSAKHDIFYEEHIRGKDANFMGLVTQLYTWLSTDKESYIPIADPLHVLKNIRAKLISHPISLYPDAPATDISVLREILALGQPLDDESQIGKMRDGYVTQLFTFENVAKLLARGSHVNGFLILPFACWTAVLFCHDLTLNLRLFLVELAYHMIRNWEQQFPKLHDDGVAYRHVPGHSSITFNDKHYVKRLMNTLAAFGVCLGFSEGCVRLDSLGTHLVENSIGIARSTSNGDPRYTRILASYAHGELRKELAAELGICIHVPGRVNDGGCKLDPCIDLEAESRRIAKPKDWRVDEIVQLAHAACSRETGPAMKDDVLEFAQDLANLSPALDVRHYKISDTANSCIMARLIAYGAAKH